MLVTRKNIELAEQRMVQNGTSYIAMIRQAGADIARYMQDTLGCRDKKVLFLCGKGKNGADGFVAASLLGGGAEVSVLLADGAPKGEEAMAIYTDMPVSVSVLENIEPARLDEYDIIVDCIYGTGFSGELPAHLRKLSRVYNRCTARRIAVDIPTGVNCDTGRYVDCFKADITIALSALKACHCVHWAKSICGNVVEIENSITTAIYDLRLASRQLDEHLVTLPPRMPWGNKGDNGRLVLVCGSRQYAGAALLACRAALHSGVGYVYLLSVESVCQLAVAAMPELVCVALPSNIGGTLSDEGIGTILSYCKRADAVGIGCGMGANEDTSAIVDAVLRGCTCPVVADADAINALALSPNVLCERRECELMLTPHPAELDRLSHALSEKLLSPQAVVAKVGAQLVLKDSITNIYTESTVYTSFWGGTGLARAGSGDVLTGIIASFTAQGLGLTQAAQTALWLQGRSLALACAEYSERCVLPSDLPKLFGRAIAELSQKESFSEIF